MFIQLGLGKNTVVIISKCPCTFVVVKITITDKNSSITDLFKEFAQPFDNSSSTTNASFLIIRLPKIFSFYRVQRLLPLVLPVISISKVQRLPI